MPKNITVRWCPRRGFLGRGFPGSWGIRPEYSPGCVPSETICFRVRSSPTPSSSCIHPSLACYSCTSLSRDEIPVQAPWRFFCWRQRGEILKCPLWQMWGDDSQGVCTPSRWSNCCTPFKRGQCFCLSTSIFFFFPHSKIASGCFILIKSIGQH